MLARGRGVDHKLGFVGRYWCQGPQAHSSPLEPLPIRVIRERIGPREDPDAEAFGCDGDVRLAPRADGAVAAGRESDCIAAWAPFSGR